MFDNDVLGSLLEYKWNRKNDSKFEDFNETQNKFDEDLLSRMTLLNNSNNAMIEAKENILYYIAGYIGKKVYKLIDCSSCIESLRERRNEHDYSIPLKHKQFVLLKNKGS